MKYTMAQATAFYDVISALNERGCSCGKVHLLASYGLINYPELAGDYARIGIALYGVLSNRADLDSCPIVGRICMDQMLVDITDTPNVKSGDVAVLVGKSGRHEITA